MAQTEAVTPVIGTGNPDILIGGNGSEVISGRAGDDILTGNSGNDQVWRHENPPLFSQSQGKFCESLAVVFEG